jgi:hypothetical protein
MKNKTGKTIGFIIGVAGFLLLFKIIFLVRIPPEDELAPGIVVLAAIMNGLLFAYLGSLIQNSFVKERNYK